nr:RHS repeat-associated core domain-containing protein [Cognaticolwellia aestuarii]
MNGRVYDYNLGRFLSVDLFIQEPGNSQSINPYSYIMNNPLAGTEHPPQTPKTRKLPIPANIKTFVNVNI